MNNIQIDFDYLPTVNFASYQNHIYPIKYILEKQISLSYPDLVREAAKLFGYARVGSNVEGAMVAGIRYALAKGFAIQDGDRVVGK